jgi:hypothetical protein
MPRKKSRLRVQTFWALLIAGPIFLGLNSDEKWLLRALSAALFLIAALSVFVSFIASRRFVFIGPRLIESSIKVRLAVEIFCRAVNLGLSIFIAPILFYMWLDLADVLERGYPIRAEAIVVYNQPTTMWSWVWKYLDLQTTDGATARYNLFFHPHYPKQALRYEVVLLPRSKCVLSLRPVEQ